MDNNNRKQRGTVAVVVVGDVGRSPRMQYHSLSLANNNFKVELIGYEGREPRPEIKQHSNIKLHLLKNPTLPSFLQRIFIFRAIYKVFMQIFALFWTLFLIQKPDFVLVQTPPAIPILAVAHLVCFFRGSKLVIDWHNFGYTILAMNKGERHFTVKIYKWYEKYFGRGAFGNFCVTKAMKEELHNNWNVEAQVLYDKPPNFFRRTNLQEKHELFMKLKPELSKLIPLIEDENLNVETSHFTTFDKKNKKYGLRSDRMALLVSSTSWTKDEDFSIMIEAMKRYNEIADSSTKNSSPNILLIVTGSGDLKEYYEEEMRKLNLKHVVMTTMWLEPEDYPLLLGSADIGISLHVSSSNLDLPMKVVDMFGCGLPVCAIGFKCLNELVKHGENGLVFESSNELADDVFDLLKNFPDETNKLEKMQQKIVPFQKNRWEDNWNSTALPLFLQSKKKQ